MSNIKLAFKREIFSPKYTAAGHPQPTAGNMMELSWDPELARLAQALADQCVFSHECADCRRVERFR